MNERFETAIPWLFVLGSVLVWELACIAFQIPSFVLPRPSLVVIALYERFGPIIDNSWMTLVRTLFGFAIAVVLGALLGIAIGSSRLIYRGLYPVLVGFNSIPQGAGVP